MNLIVSVSGHPWIIDEINHDVLILWVKDVFKVIGYKFYRLLH